jgi:hypothetical protein
MDMKKHMLICFFISTLVGKEKGKETIIRMEVVIKKEMRWLRLEMK